MLRLQSLHSEKQFAASPDLNEEVLNAVMDADSKFGAMWGRGSTTTVSAPGSPRR